MRDRVKRVLSLGLNRPVFTEAGRSYFVQGAFGWILARSPWAVPIPGFRTVEQVEGLVKTMTHEPLSPEQMAAIAGPRAQQEQREPEPALRPTDRSAGCPQRLMRS